MHAFPEVTQGETLAIHAAGELVLPQDLSEPAHVDRAAENLSIACSGVARTPRCPTSACFWQMWVFAVARILACPERGRGPSSARPACILMTCAQLSSLNQADRKSWSFSRSRRRVLGLAKCWSECTPRR